MIEFYLLEAHLMDLKAALDRAHYEDAIATINEHEKARAAQAESYERFLPSRPAPMRRLGSNG